MILLQDRYRGVLVGVLCGDALGAPYETWTEERILADVRQRDGLVLFDYDDPFGKDGVFPGGRPTDDSELTAVLAEHLINDVCVNDLYRRFRRCVVDKVSALSETLPSRGFGGTTRRALAAPTFKEATAQVPERKPLASNGALMRTSPIALKYHGMPSLLTNNARKAALVTHTHPQAVDATVMYVHILDFMLLGLPYERAVHLALHRTLPMHIDTEILAIFKNPAQKPPAPKGFGGGVVHTLQVVHYAMSNAASFQEGIEMAVTIGSDTDTYGAIAGGLLGARYCLDAIPTVWFDNLIGATRMIELADELYAKRVGP